MARERGDRRGVHDVPGLAPLEHAGQERVDPVQHAEDVHSEQPVPVFDLEVLHVAEDEDAGVVAQYVDRAELVVGRVGEGPHRREVGHIRVPHDRARAARRHLVGDRAARVLLDVSDHDVHPGAGQLEHDRAPDAAPASRDHRGLSRQVFHHVLV